MANPRRVTRGRPLAVWCNHAQATIATMSRGHSGRPAGRPERRIMGISAAPGMTSEEIVALSRAHTVFSWSVQGALDPIAIDRAEGVYLYTPEGKRILDFNSQLMSVNIGHGDQRVVRAITEQATKLQYVQPAFATEIRARLGRKLAEIMPGDMNKVFFTLGGAEASRTRSSSPATSRAGTSCSPATAATTARRTAR